MLPQVFRDVLDSLLCFPTSLLFSRRIRIPRTDTAATVLLGALGVTSVFVTSSGSSASLLRLRLPATRTAPSGTRSTWFPRVRRWVVLAASASEGPFLITEAPVAVSLHCNWMALLGASVRGPRCHGTRCIPEKRGEAAHYSRGSWANLFPRARGNLGS